MTSRGNNHLVIDQLLQDALLWVKVEKIVNEQRRHLVELAALFAVAEYDPGARTIPLSYEGGIEDFESFRAAVGEFGEYLAAGIKNLRDKSQELISLVSRLTTP